MTGGIDLTQVPVSCWHNVNHPQFEAYYNDVLAYGDEWTGEYKGYDLYIVRRTEFQYCCGYIMGNLPEDLNMDDIECHGGITFSEDGSIGMDCFHGNDFVPGKENQGPGEVVFRGIGFVIEELKKIVDQLLVLSQNA